MKKVLSIILAVILTAGCLSGCNFGGKSDRA
jgi:predicted small secreted protein